MKWSVSPWVGGILSVAVHLMALLWLGDLLQPRLYVARAGGAVMSVSLLRAAEQEQRGGVLTAPAPLARRESRELVSQRGQLPEVIAKTRESASLPETDPYFPPEELLSHPQPIGDIALDEDCLRQGKIVLKLWINASGQVDRIEKVDSAAEERCVEMAKQAFRSSAFTPGKRDDKPVKSLWFVEIWHATDPP